MLVFIIVYEKFFRQDFYRRGKFWEMRCLGFGLVVDRNSWGCLESFKVVCFSGFVLSEAYVF